ncbi:hypothetical protein [Xenorhabdus griffiniae]|uniref:Acetyltransferase n=1 Tax=Xenorhabdus griffiniae TaxID=351672 RepID=A0ABY9XFD7_9GAMM|nr:hypothetical protein [Xenorhabdus griffiniae]WMV71603.1 hypothetical protein QL128_15840 [Xenorhabdus griffiniae]WNH01280.1 hypothetical protein QL112_015845 [Xenorhabdus griffiniae]
MLKSNLTFSPVPTFTIMQLDSINTRRDELIHSLHNCVESNASIGFIAPLEENEAEQYWQDVEADLISSHRVLLVALEGENIAGSVQLPSARKRMDCTVPM